MESDIPKIAEGVNSFPSLVQKSSFIIDKSLLIKEFLENAGDVLLVTYPRRWGKTINMSMLKSFFEIEIDASGVQLPEQQKQNHKLFEHLKIWQEKEIVSEHFGKYPVIHLSLKDVNEENYENILNELKQRITELYENYEYLKNSQELTDKNISDFVRYLQEDVNELDIKNSLLLLAKLLHKHFGKQAIILIDEYDSTINHVNLKFDKTKDAEKVIELFRGIFGKSLKENMALHKGYITGITRIAKANLLSGINNLGEYNIHSHLFAQYYGFNLGEMQYMFGKYEAPLELQEAIKEWYNGYNVGKFELYNPWAVVKALNGFISNNRDMNDADQFLKSYWEQSGSMSFMEKIFEIKEVKEKIQRLVDGSNIGFALKEQLTVNDLRILHDIIKLGSNYRIDSNAIDILFSYLFFAGYITLEKGERYKYRVPNHEIGYELGNKILTYYKAQYTIGFEDFSKVTDSLKIILDRGNSETIDALLEEFRIAFKALLDRFPRFEKITDANINDDIGSGPSVHGNEDLVHSVMNHVVLQIVAIEKFGTEVHLGDGRADIAFIDKKTQKAVIIEMKFHNDLEKALAQIKDKRYGQQLGKKYDCIIAAVSTDMDKNVELAYEFIPKQLAESGDKA